jgi:small subunit ribosomal protein S9
MEEVVQTAAPAQSTTGRRKDAVARVRIVPGTGQRRVNGKPAAEYFGRQTLSQAVERPLAVTKTAERFDVEATVRGGGLAGQAGALSLGIARALAAREPECITVLRSEGLLTRDPRMKERKKYGQPGARKRFQFSKR